MSPLAILYPFKRPPIEMMEEATIQPGGLDTFHIASFRICEMLVGKDYGVQLNGFSGQERSVARLA